jgi:hypothetical protein
MNEVELRQPPAISFIGRFQVGFWMLALIGLSFYTWREYGSFRTADVPLFLVVVAFNLLAWTQLLLKPRAILLNSDGIRVTYYGGRNAHLNWAHISYIENTDAIPSKGAKQLLHLAPNKGLRLKIDDRMSNFGQAEEMIVRYVRGADNQM